jgi:hypothetical protein
MSGWDTPSRPTWDPQDGPEDGTQAFPVPDASGPDDRWSRPAGSGWGGSGPADGQDFGRADFGAPDFGSGSAFGSAGAFGGDTGGSDLGPADYDRADLGRADYRAPSFSPEPNGFSPEPNGFSPGDGSTPPPSEFFTQAFEQRQPGATLAGRELPGRGRYETGPQASARDEPPWPGPARQESARQESARQESARPDYGRTGDYGGTGEYGRQDLGRADLDRPAAPGQDFPRRDPGRADFSAPSAYSTYSGQPDQAEQAPPAANRGDAELAARMDPALQDFFAPTKPDPRYTSARPNRAVQPPGMPGPGLPNPDQQDPGQPNPGQSNLRQSNPGQAIARRPSPGLPDPGQPGQRWSDTGPIRRDDGRRPQLLPPPAGGRDDEGGQRRPRSHDGRGDAHELVTGGKGKRILAAGAVAAVVVAGGAYLALHKSNNSNGDAAADATPTASAPATGSTATTQPKTKDTPAKSGVTSRASSSGGYLLSTPSTAAGYPIGTDPKFLATAKSTVATIEHSAVSGGGGKVSGSPVAASYTLPDAQTIEFVGYQGTFNPSKVMTNLGSFGASESTYPAGPNGGELACANTTATSTTPSGAVCVWVTKSTLGFTEFFTQADGPEALNSAQSKGAEDTVSLRASVEKLKSGSQ